MKTRSLLLPFLGLCCLFGLSSAAWAQHKIDVDKPDFDSLETPMFGGNTGKKKFKPKEWLEIEAKFKIEKINPMPKDKYVNKILVKWYVAFEDPNSRGTFVITKNITHVNIPIGEDIYTSVYLSPSTIARITGGSDNASKSIIKSAGFEILYNGELLGGASSQGKAGWWRKIDSSKGLALTNKYTLRNKDETPFKSLWWDRYAEIRTERD